MEDAKRKKLKMLAKRNIAKHVEEEIEESEDDYIKGDNDDLTDEEQPEEEVEVKKPSRKSSKDQAALAQHVDISKGTAYVTQASSVIKPSIVLTSVNRLSWPSKKK